MPKPSVVLFCCILAIAGGAALAGPRAACSDAAKCLAECTDHIARSCTVLGGMYENGIGVTENRDRAMKFYKSGCELGDKDACQKGKGAAADAAGDRAAQDRAASQQAQAAAKQAEDEFQAASRRFDDCQNVACVGEHGRCIDAVPDQDTCWGPGHPPTSPEADACEAKIKADRQACISAFNRCMTACEPDWREAQRKHSAR